MLYAGPAQLSAGRCTPCITTIQMEEIVAEGVSVNPERKCADCGAAVTNKNTVRCQNCYFASVRRDHAKNRGVRAEAILAKRRGGASIISIAKEMGVSRIRVYQILDAYKRDNPQAFEANATV